MTAAVRQRQFTADHASVVVYMSRRRRHVVRSFPELMRRRVRLPVHFAAHSQIVLLFSLC